MGVIICRWCDRYIDLDWDVEHEEECAWEKGIEWTEDAETLSDVERETGIVVADD